MAVSACLTISSLHVNGLNAPIKTYRVTDWIKKNKTHLSPATRDSLHILTHTQSESKGIKK